MNKRAVFLIGICMAILFGVPLFFRSDRITTTNDALKVIIISPHNEQIRYEFSEGFEGWYKSKYGKDVQVVWSVPGGTSEIRRMLQSQYQHAIDTGEEAGGDADLVFGGGSYEHGELKKPLTSLQSGIKRTTTITVPVTFEQSMLDEIYGENLIGDLNLYDPEGYWYGIALSGFGIVYNNDVLEELSIAPPSDWVALCNPKLFGRLALVNPAQSGSVTTTFDAILKNVGWVRGWQILRRAAANARYFSASSLKSPTDVSQGDAAMGVCIDFYGRYQSQIVKQLGGGDRVGYIDPPNATLIDADPISLLRGAPHRKLALHFIEYCLTRKAQSLWQFSVRDTKLDGLGPKRWELRRMPVRREMYTLFMDRMVDQVNPYEIASPSLFPDHTMRAFIAPIFSGMAMDNHGELKDAWIAILQHPAYPDTAAIVTSDDVENEELRAMLLEFDAMPQFRTDENLLLGLNSEANRQAIKFVWLSNHWVNEGLWHKEEYGKSAFRKIGSEFFRSQYVQVVDGVAK